MYSELCWGFWSFPPPPLSVPCRRRQRDLWPVTVALCSLNCLKPSPCPVDHSAAPAAAAAHTKRQKNAKNYIEKLVKLTDHTCACNNLTNFQCEAKAINGNGSNMNMLKLAYKNSWNHFMWTYFRRVLASWNHCGQLEHCAPPPLSFQLSLF